MRILDRLFQNRALPAPAPAPSISEQLITAIVSGELKRRELADVADQRRAELDLKKMELEMSHLETIGEEKRKDAADRQRLRELRQQSAQNARNVRAQKRGTQTTEQPCRVCASGGTEASLTAEEILFHHAGHRAPVATQWPN